MKKALPFLFLLLCNLLIAQKAAPIIIAIKAGTFIDTENGKVLKNPASPSLSTSIQSFVDAGAKKKSAKSVAPAPRAS